MTADSANACLTAGRAETGSAAPAAPVAALLGFPERRRPARARCCLNCASSGVPAAAETTILICFRGTPKRRGWKTGQSLKCQRGGGLGVPLGRTAGCLGGQPVAGVHAVLDHCQEAIADIGEITPRA